MREKVESMVKSMIQELYGFASSVARICQMNPESMKNGLQIEFTLFVLYLAEADGEFTEEERQFLEEYFDFGKTISEWKQFVENSELDINKPSIPNTFQAFTIADNIRYRNDKMAMSLPEIYIYGFKIVGELFLGADGEVSENEIEKLSTYINLLQNFYEENTERTNINKPEPINVNIAKKIVVPQKELKNGNVISGKFQKRNFNSVTVRFFDKEYDVPEDALTFLQCREFVSNGLIKLLDESTKLMNKYSRLGGEKAFAALAEDTRQLQRSMLSVVQDVHKDLLSREIYDVDEVELFEQTPSIKQVETRATEVSLEMLNAAKAVQSQNQAMRDCAYRSAASNITGSGVRIFTNSFTSLMVHSAIENSILKSQAKKADQEYEQALRRISSSSGDKFTQITNDGIFNKFLPSLPEIFTTFHDELFKCYLIILAQHNQFNIDNIERYSENKSSTMLENIKYAGDKRKLLIQAFEECPFNIKVYEKMLELGYFDIDTMKDAKKIFKGTDLDNLLEEKIKAGLNNIDSVKDYITVLAYYKGKDERAVLLPFYEESISRIKKGYYELSSLCTDSVKLDKWISENIDSDIDKIAVHTEEQVKLKVDSWVKRKIKDSEFAELSRLKLLTIEDIRMKGSTVTTLEEAKAEYVNKIIAQIMEYIKEANIRKDAYEEAYGKYNSVLDQKCKVIDNKKAELKEQGIFAFSKKKEIKAELEALQKDLEEFMRTEPVKFKDDYYGVYDKRLL